MKKVIMVCFLIFAILYMSIGCDDEKGGSYSLTGTVSNVLRLPLAGRTLQCITYNEDSRIANETLSVTLGANGEFAFNGLDFNNYQLVLLPLDTLDSVRTFTDSTGFITRKPVYSNGRFINGVIGMARNEVLYDTVLSAGATATTIQGTLMVKDTIKSSTGADSMLFSRSDSAYISFSLVPDTNWSNPVLTTRTLDTNGAFQIGGIPRVKVSNNTQVHYLFNCRIVRRGYLPLRIDSISANAAIVNLDTLQLYKQ